MSQQQQLVILDVNGLLAHKQRDGWWELVPGVYSFLSRLHNKYQVALYSSTTWKRLRPLVERLTDAAEMAFVWDQKMTERDETTPPHVFVFQKRVTRVWKELGEQWNRTNTLLLEHEMEKLPEYTAYPKNHLVFEEGDTFEELEEKIERAFRVMNVK